MVRLCADEGASMKRFETIDDLISWFGSRKKMASVLGVTDVAIHNWTLNGIPAKRALDIERKTDGIVHFNHIRHLVRF